MILPARFFGMFGRKSISFGATAAPSRTRANPSSSRRNASRRFVARLQGDKRFDDFERHRIGLADHAGFGDRRMFEQHALDLERADQMSGRLDHIVGTADEPVVAVAIAPGEVAGQVVAAEQNTSGNAPRPTGTPRNIDGQPGRSASSPSVSGVSTTSIARSPVSAHDGGLDARQRASHRARPDVHRRESSRS